MRELSSIEKMINGYGETQKKTLNNGQEGFTKSEVIKKDNKEERPLLSIEKMILGYGEDGLQKEKETNVDPNDIKQEGKEKEN